MRRTAGPTGIFRASRARSRNDGDGNGRGAGAGARGGGGGRGRAYGVDRKTFRTWAQRGQYAARSARAVVSCLHPHRDWLAQRAPEVDYNATVLFRELQALGFPGSVIIVRRAVVPLRKAAIPPAATVRYETAPGAQAQVDVGQTRVWIADVHAVAQIFVMTLGFSRRCFAVAFRRQRLREWLAGHEQAFQHFGGVTDTVLVDNAKAMVLTHTRETLAFHPIYADFCGYDGVRPCACQPYRPQTKGTVESGVTYVVRNALATPATGSATALHIGAIVIISALSRIFVRPLRTARQSATTTAAFIPIADSQLVEKIQRSKLDLSICFWLLLCTRLDSGNIRQLYLFRNFNFFDGVSENAVGRADF